MRSERTNLSNPFSTGGGGAHFEAHVQASFVVLMLTGGHAPCLPCWPIKEIKLQGRIDGFETDDLIVSVEKDDIKERRKLLGQVKHSVSITKNSTTFRKVLHAAWLDFNNPQCFSKSKDIIALITGPLSATDSHNVQWLLSQARHTRDVDEFFRNVEQFNFSPPKSNEKLAVIQYHLKSANGGVEVPKDQLYSFLRHFHILGYDLGKEVGVVLSLLHSHISQFHQQAPQFIWSRVVDIVQSWNQDAGTITLKDMPEDLVKIFEQRAIAKIPKELTTPKQTLEKTDWLRHQYASDFALANLVGAWYEKNEFDISVLTKILGTDYDIWVQKARQILLHPDSHLSLKNGQWNISDRVELWNSLGSHIFDQNLDKFKSVAVEVLTEHDPSFELPVEERFIASIHGKVLNHSQVIRNGLAEGLAILGCNPHAFSNCTQGKAENTAILVIREIFTDADWILWGSLNHQLPTLAEAAPDEFLSAVENSLALSSCPFDQLFAQEGKGGIAGGYHLTGLLWALEGLAWDKKHLVRVCVVLGELASHDPGGQLANRPANSLTTILLPWLPQTLASIEKRKAAVQTLIKEWPEVGWELLIHLLPNQHQSTSGSHKPSWRKTIPDDWEKGVSNREYWEQVSFYAELAVSSAGHDTVKLAKLIDNFTNLPKQAFDHLLEVLSSDAISSLPEEQRLLIWDHMARLTIRHRRYSDAKWAFPDELITSIEAVANKLAPVNPINLYQPLFSDRDFDFFEESENWEEQEQKLDTRRDNIVKEIFNQDGTDAVIQFTESVESPYKVGCSLAAITDSSIEQALLPDFLNSDDRSHTTLVSGFVWRRHYINGWSWCDGIDKSSWSKIQIGIFLSLLPFKKETWERVSQWLKESEDEYWSRTNANAYQADMNLDIAIDKLIKFGRPYAAINCLYRMIRSNQQINVEQCVKALLSALSSKNPTYTVDEYRIVELIKFLQSNTSVLPDDLFNVEWAYLPLLDGHRGAVPKLLENRLSGDPEFFCDVLRLVYKSEKKDEQQKEPPEELKRIASNAWRLLHKWKTPPGMQADGVYNGASFLEWLQRVRMLCTESGHLKVALTTIGAVLIHSPADPDGLWINRIVAEALNDRDSQKMRNGFRNGIYNSRGVCFVDPTGKPEKELAEQFHQKADAIENAGFHRLAGTLRDLAGDYEQEAERIINDYKVLTKTEE